MSTNRQYELVYIVTPEATDEQVAELHTQIEQIVQRFNGTFDKTENWGRRKLAYEIGHHREGNYVVETITGSGELMKEIDRRLRVIDSVIRHLVVRVDEELRVAERTRDARKATQARRRTARGLPPEPQPGEGRGDNMDQDDDRGDRYDRGDADRGTVRGAAMSEERGGRGRGGGEGRRTPTRTRAAIARAAGSSAAAASASSARRRSTTSTTRTSGCWRRSCPSAARSSRGGSPAPARCTSASCRRRSSARASWR